MSEKGSAHVEFIKVISPWLPDSTGREGLCSCRADIRWSSAPVSPIWFSETSWPEFGLVCRPKSATNRAETCMFVYPFIFDIHRAFGVKERGEIAWMVDGTLTGSKWQFFLRGKSGWHEFLFPLTLCIQLARYATQSETLYWSLKKKQLHEQPG